MAKYVLSAFADEASDSLEGQIAALLRNGIYRIEPRNINGKSVSYMSEAELKAVRSALDEAGIGVSSLGSPIGKYPIHDDFGPHFEQFEKALFAAKALGADRIRMFSFFCKKEERGEVRGEVLSRLVAMLDRAEQEGITLCHENEADIYGEMPSEVQDLLHTLPKLKGIFDPANYRMAGANIHEGIKATLPSLSYIHIKDAIFEEQMIVPAGEGEGEIPYLLDLVDRQFDGVIYLTLEPHLKLFGTYAAIDQHDLKGKYQFSTNDESFDFAANALKEVLKGLGFSENSQHQWVRGE